LENLKERNVKSEQQQKKKKGRKIMSGEKTEERKKKALVSVDLSAIDRSARASEIGLKWFLFFF
jgi:hypothetical protein